MLKRITCKVKAAMEQLFQNKIFVVEDDAIFGSVIQKALELDGNSKVTIFKTGEEFFNNIYLNPDIITIDHSLPGKDGIEVLKQIRNFNAEIPTIFFSGTINPEVVIDAYESGVSGYIIKNEKAIEKLRNCVKDLSVKINLRKEISLLRDKITDRSKYDNKEG